MNCIKVSKKDVAEAVERRLERVGVRSRFCVSEFIVELSFYSTDAALCLLMRNEVAAAMADIYISEVSDCEVERPLFTMTSIADAKRTNEVMLYDEARQGFHKKSVCRIEARFVRNIIAK